MLNYSHFLKHASGAVMPKLHLASLAESVRLFDVTLRDGLQSSSKPYTFNDKKYILHQIVHQRKPNAIEIGSIVSAKVLPEMKDSIKLYKYAEQQYPHMASQLYMLLPNVKAMYTALDNGIKNASFITSISDAFQKNNVNKTLKETKIEISEMLKHKHFLNTKLYISCIPSCPIIGSFTIERIVNEILSYQEYSDTIDEFCISDTCGTMTHTQFNFILHHILPHIPSNKISLHLHVNQDNIKEVNKIILHAINRDVTMFDVSHISGIGGCSVTMKDTKQNLTYEQLYSVLDRW